MVSTSTDFFQLFPVWSDGWNWEVGITSALVEWKALPIIRFGDTSDSYYILLHEYDHYTERSFDDSEEIPLSFTIEHFVYT